MAIRNIYRPPVGNQGLTVDTRVIATFKANTAKKKGGITFHLLLFHHTLDPLLLDPTMDIHPPKAAVRHGCRKICSLDENTQAKSAVTVARQPEKT